MQTGGVRKLLDRFGFGWIISSREEIKSVTLSDIKPIPLLGNFDSGFALGEYSIKESAKREKTVMGHLLHKFKYEQDRHAGMILTDLASDFINRQVILKSCDLMLTVPPSFRSRSFDPVSFIAERIEEKTKIRWEKDVLKRTKLTTPQKSIWDKELKQLNVFNTFRLAKPLQLERKKILLIDDVCASGATLNEISHILRAAKADKIYVLVLVKTAYLPGSGSINY
jgi:predicted amidophosphoribosyltransferase